MRQCRFFLENGSFMVRDESSGQTTGIHPRKVSLSADNTESHPKLCPEKWEFSGIPRQRAVLQKGIWQLTLGRAQFFLEFKDSRGKPHCGILFRGLILIDKLYERDVSEKEKQAVKTYPINTDPPPQLQRDCYETRVQTPQVPEDKRRGPVTYQELQHLGNGRFGRVSRVIDLVWGGMMALKLAEFQKGKEKQAKERLKKEVEILAQLKHVRLIY